MNVIDDRRRWVSDSIRVTPEEAAKLYVHHIAMAASFFTTFDNRDNEIFHRAISRLSETTKGELVSTMARSAFDAGVGFCTELAEDVW